MIDYLPARDPEIEQAKRDIKQQQEAKEATLKAAREAEARKQREARAAAEALAASNGDVRRTQVPPEVRPKREPVAPVDATAPRRQPVPADNGVPSFKNVLAFKPTRVMLPIAELARRRGATETSPTDEEWPRYKDHCPAHVDPRPSLTYFKDPNTDRYVWNCFTGGCKPADIERAMLVWLAAHPTPPPPTAAAQGRDALGPVVKTYDYRNLDGNIIFQVRRHEPKDFRVWRRHGEGWAPGFGDLSAEGKHLLYRRPQVQGETTVYCPAGEKDVETCEAWGLVATTNQGGENKWRAEHVQQLRDAGCTDLIVPPDQDETGLRFAEVKARMCTAAGIRVKVITLPGLPPKGDITDWVAAGHTREELDAIVTAAPIWTAAAPQPTEITATDNPWEYIETVDALLAREDPAIEEIEPRMLMRGCVTQIAAPRGVGKTQYAHWLAVKLGKQDKRVLLVDRDNPTKLLKKRLRAWGATNTPTLAYIGREHAPSLFDKDGWGQFPDGYDVVIVDSLYSAAEGLDEKNTGRASRAMASMLDLARRATGPAVLVLNNTTRDAKASRGSGVIEDRGDVVYEVRDMTGYRFNGKKPWHEEVAEIPAGAAEWARRITARKGVKVYRLGFFCTKYRYDAEPAPFVYEVDHRTEPSWTITDVTGEVEHGSAAALSRYQEREGLACAMLSAQITAKQRLGLALKKTEAVLLLRPHLGRNDAEAFLERGVGKHWRIEAQPDKPGRPKVLRPLDIPTAQTFTRPRREPVR